GLQSATAGKIDRRICRPHEQSEACESEDDGHCGTGQCQGRPCPGENCPSRLGGNRNAGACVGRQDGRRTYRFARAFGTRTSRHDPRLTACPLPCFAGKHQRRRDAARACEIDEQAPVVLLCFWRAFGDGGSSGTGRGSRFRVPYPGRHRRLEKDVRPAQSLRSPRNVHAGFVNFPKFCGAAGQCPPLFFGLPPPPYAWWCLGGRGGPAACFCWLLPIVAFLLPPPALTFLLPVWMFLLPVWMFLLPVWMFLLPVWMFLLPV